MLFPFFVPVGGGIPEKEMSRIEVVGSIYFLIVLLAGILGAIWASYHPEAACDHPSWTPQGCRWDDLAMWGFGTAVTTMVLLTIATVLFLSIRRLWRAATQSKE